MKIIEEKEDGSVVIGLPPMPKVRKKKGQVPIIEHKADGSVEVSYFKMPADLQAKLDAARAEWKKLEEAGTPYWCIHKNRSVTHPSAYWKEDGYFREDGIQMQFKHGVMCRDCGGYIQEG